LRLLVLGLALALAPTAYAQSAGTWQAGLGGGRAWHDTDGPLDHGWEVVPRLAWFFADGVGVEGELPVGFGSMAEGSQGWLTVTPRAHLIGYLARDFALRPYVLGGVEVPVYFAAGTGEEVRSPAVGVRLYGGPGLQIDVTDAFALRGDLRWGLSLATLDTDHRALSEYELTFGVQIAWGERPAEPAPAPE